MSTNGILDFQNTNKVIFRGTDSNVVVDTSNASIGIGIQGTEKPGSNLHVIGDASISSNLKLTTDTSITVNSNVVTDFNGPHARLPITQAIVEHPIMHIDKTAERPTLWTANDNSSNISVKAGYTVTASTVFNSGVSNFDVFRLYDGHPDGNAGTYYCSGGTAGNGTSYSTTSGLYRDTTTSGGYSGYGGTPITTTVSGVSKAGEWLGIETPHPIVLKYVTMTSESHETYAHASPHKGVFAGSHDGVTWESISTFDDFMAGTDGTTRGNGNGTTDINIGPHRLDVNSTTAYKYHRMIVEAIQTTYGSAGGGAYLILDEMRWYGCNDNPPAGDISVDTTFKSVMNTPQTTGANVYVDAKLSSDFTNQVTGPTGVGSAVTHDSTNKYWEMNGQLTSNITVEANTFLEGDQPHAVSVWFNSSNLEANVSNTCVFSIASEEKLDSVNLDLQSNTWHNLTYSYQGEGGSRVTYLDGQKVSEDQAEDTFGDYPPFAMTGYSQGGYVVSASSEQSSTRASWKAFNDVQNVSNTTEDNWESGAKYSSGSPYNANQTTYITDTNGTPHYGEWIAIEMPEKLKFGYFNMVSPVANRRPDSMVIVGSNDGGVTFDHIKTISSVTYPSNNTTTIAVNSAYAYNKFYFIVTSVDGANTVTNISHLAIYGHRENDLVRLPDPTHVLEYPHIAMTGPAQRGYVASASSILSDDYRAFKMFADDDASNPSPYGGYGWWASQHNKYRQSGDNDYLGGTTDNLGTYTGSSTATDNGVWVQLKMPHKILLSSVFLGNGAWYETAPGSFKFYGTNNDQDWTLIQSFTGKNPQAGTSYAINATVAYKTIGLVITHTAGTALNSGETGISEMKFYGTGVDSIPIQIGGGNIDKVANFRVYDKFVGEDQALEIWDAQKDEFGRAKSSMTLYKGRIGLGTEEPEGRLAVLDEPNGLEEFPPRAMSGHETYMEGHGVFKATADSHGAGDTSIRHAWKAFIKGTTESVSNGDNSWLDNSGDFNSTTGVYDGSLTHHSGSVSGEYLQLELPYEIQLSSYSLAPWNYPTGTTFQYSDFPRDFIIYGSKDSISWDIVDTRSGQSSISQADVPKYHVNSQKTYRYFVIVVTKINTETYANSAVYVAIGEWRLFGTREQGQSVLHDGQLTLTKNLDVPRIGPDLDADDTPRRDRLVVEYNTSTNPTFEGAVRDTSGRGNDAVFRGSSSYDATEKAFDLRSHDKDLVVVRDNISGVSGDILGTISLWFKTNDTTQTTGMTMFQIGHANTTGHKLNIFLYEDDVYMGWGGSNYVYAPSGDVKRGKWTHVVGIKKGKGAVGNGTVQSGHTAVLELYIDGVKKAVTNWTGTDTLNITKENQIITVGAGSLDSTTRSNGFDGFISTVKFWGGVVLTAQEVKTLYDMGRCDEGHHVVNFSKTRVGIGLGDGEVSDALLNVGGVPYGAGVRPIFSAYESDAYTFESLNNAQTDVILGNTFINHNNAYNTSTGVFTVPVTGEYHIFTCCQWRGFSSYNQGVKSGSINFVINGVGWNPTSTTRPVVTQTIRYANERKQLNGSLVIKLNKGDQLKVQCTNNLTQNVGDLSWGTGYGRFAAFLLS